MRYPNIDKVISYISADNGGCNADEIEQMLEYASEVDLQTIAAGDEQDQTETITRLLEESGAGIPIECVHDFFNAALG